MKIYNKSQTTLKMIGFTFVKMLIVILVLSIIVVMVNRYIIVDDDIREQEAEILINSLLTHPGGPVYYKESIGRAYPYTINADFFRENTDEKPDDKIEELFHYSTDEPHVAMKVELLSMSEEAHYKNDANEAYDEELSSAYLHKRQYNAWEELASVDAEGPGSVLKKERRYFVNIVDEGQVNKGIIKIVVLLMRI